MGVFSPKAVGKKGIRVDFLNLQCDLGHKVRLSAHIWDIGAWLSTQTSREFLLAGNTVESV